MHLNQKSAPNQGNFWPSSVYIHAILLWEKRRKCLRMCLNSSPMVADGLNMMQCSHCGTCPIITKSVGMQSLRVLSEFVHPEKHDRLFKMCATLDRWLVKQPSGRWLLEFDVEGDCSKYSRQQVFDEMEPIITLLEVKQDWFFQWVAENTNLANNAETVRTLHRRAQKKEKGDPKKTVH